MPKQPSTPALNAHLANFKWLSPSQAARLMATVHPGYNEEDLITTSQEGSLSTYVYLHKNIRGLAIDPEGGPDEIVTGHGYFLVNSASDLYRLDYQLKLCLLGEVQIDIHGKTLSEFRIWDCTLNRSDFSIKYRAEDIKPPTPITTAGFREAQFAMAGAVLARLKELERNQKPARAGVIDEFKFLSGNGFGKTAIGEFFSESNDAYKRAKHAIELKKRDLMDEIKEDEQKETTPTPSVIPADYLSQPG